MWLDRELVERYRPQDDSIQRYMNQRPWITSFRRLPQDASRLLLMQEFQNLSGNPQSDPSMELLAQGIVNKAAFNLPFRF